MSSLLHLTQFYHVGDFCATDIEVGGNLTVQVLTKTDLLYSSRHSV